MRSAIPSPLTSDNTRKTIGMHRTTTHTLCAYGQIGIESCPEPIPSPPVRWGRDQRAWPSLAPAAVALWIGANVPSDHWSTATMSVASGSGEFWNCGFK
jgi:hypothetical protein